MIAVATDEEKVKRDQKDVCSTHFISRPWGALARQDTSMADVIRSVFLTGKKIEHEILIVNDER